jgi:CxxC-x17-CxxC domain-containing protein
MTMYQGNWKCSACGGAITELPFQPRSEAGLTCRTCWSKQNGKNEAAPAAEPASSDSVEAPDDVPLEADLASAPMDGDPFEGMDAAPVTPGEKPKFEGDWQCSICGGPITSLPFQPRRTDGLKCLDCFKSS